MTQEKFLHILDVCGRCSEVGLVDDDHFANFLILLEYSTVVFDYDYELLFNADLDDLINETLLLVESIKVEYTDDGTYVKLQNDHNMTNSKFIKRIKTLSGYFDFNEDIDD